jgi:hypothetical protein
MTVLLMPKTGADLDPITRTWLRGLVATALELHLRPLCWHVEHQDNGTVLATGYVTVSLLHDAPAIRGAWANALGLGAVMGNYAGTAGPLAVHLPDAVDPDEHCLVCRKPFDPRDTRPDGRGRYQGGDICRSCAADGRIL